MYKTSLIIKPFKYCNLKQHYKLSSSYIIQSFIVLKAIIYRFRLSKYHIVCDFLPHDADRGHPSTVLLLPD